MPQQLTIALCLVLFAAPRQWQAAVRRALAFEPGTLRVVGPVTALAGLAALLLAR